MTSKRYIVQIGRIILCFGVGMKEAEKLYRKGHRVKRGGLRKDGCEYGFKPYMAKTRAKN